MKRVSTTLGRYAPVIGLLVLSPWVGEYLLGNVPLGWLHALPFLIPLYGGGALLIREITRRTGRGYPTMLVLGMAYGVVEAGLVDQSLFNPNFDGHVFHATTVIPLLGIGAYNASGFIIGHAIWSIVIPIAIIELLTPKRRREPWLGMKGLVATAALYLFGCWFMFEDLLKTQEFLASPAERIGAFAVTLALVVAAFASKKLPLLPSSRPAPKPLLVGICTFVLINTFFLRPETWFGVFLGIGALSVLAWYLLRMSRRQDWGVWNQFIVVAVTLSTYIYAGFILTFLIRPDDMVAWIGNVIFACGAMALLVITARRISQVG